MSSIGSLLVSGRTSGAIWAEIQECGGVAINSVSTRGTVVAAASNTVKTVGLQGQALTTSATVQHAARTVLFQQVAESKDFAVAVTSLGRVYFHGKGISGVPGVNDSGDAPIEVPTLENVTAVAAGAAHCIALKEDGTVYAWGRNDHGQLGIGPTSDAGRRIAESGDVRFTGAVTPMAGACQFQATPRFVSSLHKHRIVAVACGARHTLFVTDEGQLFACGEGTSGQLGVGRCSYSSFPVRVVFDETEGHQPSDGLMATKRSIDDSTNDVHRHQQHDNQHDDDDEGKESESQDRSSSIDTRVTAVAAGFGHSLALTRSGHVFSFGLNTHGQLGLGDLRSRSAPALVHRIARDVEGLSQQGIGADEDEEGHVFSSTQRGHNVAPLFASSVAAGPFHSAFLSTDGLLLTCGSSGDGRLGQRHMAEPGGNAVAHLSAAVMVSVERNQRHDGSSGGDDAGDDTTIEYDEDGQPMLQQNHHRQQQHAQQLGYDDDLLARHSIEGGGNDQPQLYEHRWCMPNGVGPLAPSSAQSKAGISGGVVPYQDPPHFIRNAAAAKSKQSSRAATTTSTGAAGKSLKVDAAAAREGTWTVQTRRTASHQRMRKAGQRYALEVTAGALKAPFDARVVDHMDVTAHAASAVLAANPRQAPKVKGMPWLRAPRPACTDEPVSIPTPVRHPVLAGRVITKIACADAETIVFSPSTLQRAFPHACADYGGTIVTLSGPGLNSVARVPEAALHARLVAADTQEGADAAVATYTPTRDATGMWCIPGVFVRWTCRFDTTTAGVSRTSHNDARKPLRSGEVHFSRAYFAVGADFSGFRGIVSRPYPFSVRVDGTLFHSTADGLQLDVDTIQTIAPAVSRPCSAVAELVVVDAAAGETALMSIQPDDIVHGQASFDFYTQPSLVGVAPPALSVSPGCGVNPVVRLTGEHLFGCALVDTCARQAAEALVAAVQAEVGTREEDEAAQLAAELAEMDATSGSKSPLSPSAASIAARKAGLVESKEADASNKHKHKKAVDLLHLSKTAGGAAAPCDILVTFDVLVDGVKVGRTDATRGWYVVNYDEHVVDVRAASRAIASATTGLMPTGTSAPVTTPQEGASRAGGALLAGAAAALGGRGAGAAAASAASGGAVRAPSTSRDSSVDGDDDAEGIVGTYSASILCTLPDLASLLKGSSLPPIPQAVIDVQEQLYARSGIGGSGGEAAPAVDADALSAALSFRYDDLLAGKGSAAAAGGGTSSAEDGSEAAGTAAAASQQQRQIQLRPRISPNGGDDWLEPPSNVLLQCMKPEVSHVSPAAVAIAPSADTGSEQPVTTVTVRGTGFVADAAVDVTLTRIEPDGSTSEAASVPAHAARVVDDTTIEVTLPSLAPLFPASEPGTDGAASPPPAGFLTLQVSCSLDGLPVLPSPSAPLHLVVAVGSTVGAPAGSAAYVARSASGPSSMVLQLARANLASCYDAPSRSIGIMSSGSGSEQQPGPWLPPSLLHGSARTGLTDPASPSSSSTIRVLVRGSDGAELTLQATYDAATGCVRAILPPASADASPLKPGPIQPFLLVASAHGVSASASRIPATGPFILYAPSSLTITGVTGPKKIVPGVELSATVDGLAALLTSSGQPPSPPAASDVLVRLSSAGVSEVVPGRVNPDAATTGVVAFNLPGPDSPTQLAGDVTVEVSLAGGVDGSWTAPSAPVKVAKK